VSERKSGEKSFKNLAPAGFQLRTYSTASYHAIIWPWNQHWNLLRHQRCRHSSHMSQSCLVNKKLSYCRETVRRALSV